MTRSSSYGDILRNARKRSGMSIADAAYRLRIRPDILRAIEECDYARMPPRGYTRNMISSYARLLGLNSREITQMYLDGAYAFEVGRVRTDGDRPDSRRGQSSQRSGSSRTRHVEREPEPYMNARGRTVYEDRTEKISRPTGQSRVHPSRHISLPSNQYTNLVASPKANTVSRLPYIIAIAAIVILLIIIAVFVLGGKDDVQDTQTPNVPVAGMTDTSNPTGTPNTTMPTIIDVKPTSAIVSYEVASGETSYIEVYVDGVTKLAESVNGPGSKEFEITGTCTFVTTNPSATTVMVDGKVAEPLDEDGDGVYILEVDFKKILEEWEAKKAAADAEAAAQQAQGSSDASASGSADGTEGNQDSSAN